MKNRQGRTIFERLNEEINHAQIVANAEHREILAVKALGAADMAVEFNLITYTEWEHLITLIFKLL